MPALTQSRTLPLENLMPPMQQHSLRLGVVASEGRVPVVDYEVVAQDEGRLWGRCGVGVD